MSHNGTPTTTADAVTRAMEASKRLLDAAAKARNACLEACQETVLGIPGVHEAVDAVAPMDWSALAPEPGFMGGGVFAEQWQRALGGTLDADELVAAGKRVCLELVDSYEQAMLAGIDVRERLAESTHYDWLRSLASASLAVERDVTTAYLSTLREFLK
jgi:hypothetical protein